MLTKKDKHELDLSVLTDYTDIMEDSNHSCCSVEAIVTIDERGQLVLPKDVRVRAGFEAGDRLAVVNWYCSGEVCCVALMKASALSGAVRSTVESVFKGGEA